MGVVFTPEILLMCMMIILAPRKTVIVVPYISEMHMTTYDPMVFRPAFLVRFEIIDTKVPFWDPLVDLVEMPCGGSMYLICFFSSSR